MSDLEREEWIALRDSDTLHLLPPWALIASVQHLARRLLEVADSHTERLPQITTFCGHNDHDVCRGHVLVSCACPCHVKA